MPHLPFARIPRDWSSNATLALAGAVLASFALAGEAKAPARVKRVNSGILSCTAGGGTGHIVTSTKSLSLPLSTLRGGRRSIVARPYRLGRAGHQPRTRRPARSAVTMAGSVQARRNLGRRLRGWRDALIGGWRRGVILQPLSVQAQKGLSIAAGIEALALRAEQPRVRVGKRVDRFFKRVGRLFGRDLGGSRDGPRKCSRRIARCARKTLTGDYGTTSVVIPPFVAVPPAAATALAMPAPIGAPWARRPAGDATVAAHIVPAVIVAYAHESGNLIDERLGRGRARTAADWRGAGRPRPQRSGDKHAGRRDLNA